MDRGFGGVSGRSVYNRVRLTLLLEARRKLELAGREVKVSVNVPRVIPDFQTPVSRACERGSSASIGHPEPQRVEIVYSIKLQVERRVHIAHRAEQFISAAPVARSIYSLGP